RQREEENALSKLAELETLLAKAIDSLDRQTELRSRQVDLAQEELDNVESLMKKGLTVSARLSELARTVAELQGSVLEAQTAKLTAEQRLNEVVRERFDVTNRRERDAMIEAQNVRGEIDELRARMDQARSLFATASSASTMP